RVGDVIGLVGRMAILFARSCAPEHAAAAAHRIATQISRETGQTLRHTAIRLPHDATHAMPALQKAERQLVAPDDVSDPLSRALRALNTRSLTMARQPIVAAGSRSPVFYEVLARLNDDENAPESMEDLIAALDAHGSIALLDHRMASLAIDALDAEPTLRLAVNVAPRSLANADWFRYVEVRLSRHGTRNSPFYHVVACHKRMRRDGLRPASTREKTTSPTGRTSRTSRHGSSRVSAIIGVPPLPDVVCVYAGNPRARAPSRCRSAGRPRRPAPCEV
ncbi:MAG: EAL domain-containing protein, partial [Ilumatobacteraceae bacterium]|nr:EAL domain-containing protein [Ilumatobacteraceae bacterium]